VGRAGDGIEARAFLASSVLVLDELSQAVSGGGEVVFEFADAAVGDAEFGGASISLGDESPVDIIEGGDALDQLCPFGSFDLGTELEPEPAAEFVVVGAQPADLGPGDDQVGVQAVGRHRRRVVRG